MVSTRISSLPLLVCAACCACGAAPSPSGEGGEASESEGATTESTTSTESAETGSGEEESETGEPSCMDAPGPWDAGAPIPAPPQLGGDPVAGEWALLHEDYVSCGIPYDLFMLSKNLLGTYADGEALPWREGKAANLPYNWNLVVTEGGGELATMNCLTCHAGEVNGELVIGLGRHDADYTQDLGGLLDLLPPLPPLTEGAAELDKFIDRYKILGPHITTYTVGTNPADIVAIILASHRNSLTLEWSDEQLIPVEPPMVPADTPPWWRVKKKAGHFHNGMSRGDHRGTMMFASSLCLDSAAEAASALDYFEDIHAYLASIEAPSYPWPIDESLAAEGEEIFECECAGCHGTYDEDPEAETYPNLLIPVELIGTDPTLTGITREAIVDVFVPWFNDSWYGTVTELAIHDPFPGYVAPPLDGIWATAPFFHNGSVPSIDLALNSSARPTYWRRVDYDSTNYDQQRLGWAWVELDYGQSEAPVGEAKHIYDTTIYAHGNGGHTFGDHLDDQQRAAVLEYLKTL